MATVTVKYFKYEVGEQARWGYTFYIPAKYSDKRSEEGKRRAQKVKKSGFKTRKVAQEHFKANYNWIELDRPDDKPIDESHTFDQLVAAYEAECSSQASWAKSKKYLVGKLSQHFNNAPLHSITIHSIKAHRNQLKQTPNGNGNLPSAATVNRYMACLRHMLAVAVDNRKLARNPFLDTQEEKGGTKKRSLQDTEKARERYLNEEEIASFLGTCDKGGPFYTIVKDFFVIAIHTGMDKGEILSLVWDQIDLDNMLLYCPQVKTRPDAHIPMSGELVDHLREIRKRKVTKYVVVDHNGKPVKEFRKKWKTICRKAKIHNFRVKDLRHSFASHFAMRTGDLATLQYILRHTTPRMTARYVHLCQNHKAAQVQKMNGLTSKSRTNIELSDHSGTKKGFNETR